MDTECLDDNVLAAFMAGRVSAFESVQPHLDRCSECRALVGDLLRSKKAGIPRARVERPESSLTDDVVAPPQPLLRAGVRIGEFSLEAPLGMGGTSLVWSARHETSGTKVALKLLRSASGEHVRRLRREAAILRDLGHPNIVAARDVFETAEWGPVLATELLAGESLESLLAARETLSFEELKPIAIDVLVALGAAHARSIIHRDVKPDNVFVTRAAFETRARILDFGMAKLVNDATWIGLTPGITKSGTILGTPLYMAPEQVFGERTIDARADLWAFGVLVYRALSGVFPLEATSLGALMKALSQRNVRPFDENTRVPHAVRSLLGRLLSIDPTERPSSVEEPLAIFRSTGACA